MFKKNLYFLLSYLLVCINFAFCNETSVEEQEIAQLLEKNNDYEATEENQLTATENQQLVPLTQDEVNNFLAELNQEEKVIFDKFLAIFKEMINKILTTEEFIELQNLLKNKELLLNIAIQFMFHRMEKEQK